MSFYFDKDDKHDSSKSRFSDSRRDRDDKYSNRDSRKRSSSKDSDRKSDRKNRDDEKEKNRDFNRERRDRDDSRNFRDNSRDHYDSRQPSKFKNEQMAGAGLSDINWNQQDLIPFKKDFYTESSRVRDRDQSEIDAFRKEHQITIRGSINPRPIFEFEDVNFPSYIAEQLTRKFKKPTPIQCQGWPAALAGYDVIGIAQTGSGKTLTFLLPGFIHINAQPSLKSGDGPVALVLAPTRELAMQIQEECQKFSRSARINSVCVFGGADRWGQKRELLRGNQMVVATPGRLLDFLDEGVINLKRVTYLVLDEADRMLDMGFEPQIRKIISQIRPDRQTLMWSATWPREVQKLALEFCREKPCHIVIGSQDLAVNNRIKQNIEVVDNVEKRFRITKIVQNHLDGSKILIFTQTKKGADQLTSTLSASGMSAIAIHGDKSQNQRDYIMRQFKTGRIHILVATDLAARGLDVDDIRCVINYDFPMHIEDYIHRVGRTGRAGRSGTSYTFFTRDDYKHAAKLVDILEETEQVVPDELYRIARRPIPYNARSKVTSHSTSDKSIYPEKNSSNERSGFTDRPNYSDRNSLSSRSYSDKPSYGGKPSYGDRSSYNNRSNYNSSQNSYSGGGRYYPSNTQTSSYKQEGTQNSASAQPNQASMPPPMNFFNPAMLYGVQQGFINPYTTANSGTVNSSNVNYQPLNAQQPPNDQFMSFFNQLQATYGMQTIPQGQQGQTDKPNQPPSTEGSNTQQATPSKQ